MTLADFDAKLLKLSRRFFQPMARAALFVVYFWFGLLKVLGLSPAEPLVRELFGQTIHFMSFGTFYALFAWFEVAIGVLFLFPRFTRLVIPLLLLHMLTTFMPLFLLPAIVWQGFLIPTLTGQYIIKNLVIIASALGIASQLRALPAERSRM